jgi:hypothetical protein
MAQITTASAAAIETMTKGCVETLFFIRLLT